MECVVYMRVSTEKQAEEGNGLESQKRDIENYCKKNEYIITDYYIDDGYTGLNTDRPNLQILLKVVGEGDLVVIKSIDRLSRNYKECKQLWEQITSAGADIVVIDMPILDTRQNKDLLGNLITDLFLTILGYVAEQETSFRKQRQLEGIKLAKEQGKHLGRPKVDFPNNWEEQYNAWRAGKQTAKVTMDNLGLRKNTFYKLVKEHEAK